jgi:RNA polymerase sigma-70 factor (ECF subfamily)
MAPVTSDAMAIPGMSKTARIDGDEGAAASRGEPLALLAVDFGRLYAVVHRYLLHRLFDVELAEELTAETFYKAVTASNRFPGDPGHMKLWLLRTATNLANTHYRKKRLHQLLLRRLATARASTTGLGVGARTTKCRDSARVRAALMALRPKYQSVVILRYYSQLSTKEIAEVLGCHQDAVRARLSRAIKGIRERLGDRSSERHPSSK